MTVAVTRDALARLYEEAAKAAPEEACGLLLADDGRIVQIRPAANVAQDRRIRFEIDPRVLIEAFRAEREGQLQIAGYYHSHPQGTPEPSPCDQEQASADGRIWAIIGPAEVRFWRDEKEGFSSLPYVVVEA
ncbi:hypothetical protein MB02_00925 [Croceicoccus estronivorus]|uniref:Mov34/MPN/PAD-1 family protein n=1 Tax=Croceicoccus estronivorus TaxID=1172626 RepID=UPI0008374F5D|nr:M67 family metallopeptidase [Croceicoccus estronivorus]OCC25272.1 hypothetical protein MB02_00925 [Croceicoccus estronivorus]